MLDVAAQRIARPIRKPRNNADECHCAETRRDGAFRAICFVASLAHGGLPWASRRFAHLIPESLRRSHAGLLQRFPSMRQWLRIAFPKNYLDRRQRAGFLFVLPALLFFGSVFILPLAQSIMYSFYKIAPGGAREFVGLRLYEKVLTDPTFWSAVWNTIQLLLFSVPTTVILALAVALGLNRITNLKWRNVWASMYFLPFATSLVTAALIWQWIYHPVSGSLNYALY